MQNLTKQDKNLIRLNLSKVIQFIGNNRTVFDWLGVKTLQDTPTTQTKSYYKEDLI